jgi:hypothetical protein
MDPARIAAPGAAADWPTIYNTESTVGLAGFGRRAAAWADGARCVPLPRAAAADCR